jgi:hypothetical protein
LRVQQNPSIAKNFELLSEAFQVTDLKAEEIEFWRSELWDSFKKSNCSNALVDSLVRHGEFSLLADVCREHLESLLEDEFGFEDESDFEDVAEIPLHYEQILRFVQKYKWSNTNNRLVLLLTRFCRFVLRGARDEEVDPALVEIGGILGNTKEELNFLKSWLRHLELDSVHDRTAEHFLDQRREAIREPIVRRLADMMVEQEEGFGTKFWEVSLWKSPGSWCIATVLQDSLVRAGQEEYAKEFWSKMRRAWPEEPHLNYFYAESARNVADFKEATKGWLTWLEFILSLPRLESKLAQKFPVETTLQSLQTALAFEFELGYIIDVWEKLLENTTDRPWQDPYLSMLQKCMADGFLAGFGTSSEQDTSFDLLVRAARLCPHDERIVAKLRASEKIGDETQLWSSWLARSPPSKLQVLEWYTVRLAQVYSFNMRFAEAEAWIDQLHEGYLDNAAVSILSEIDLGRDLRIFWSWKLEEPITHDLAVRVLVEYSKCYPDFSYLGIVELGRRRPWDRRLLGQVKEIFKGLRSTYYSESPWDEIKYWTDIFLFSQDYWVVGALAEAFRFNRSPFSGPAVRRTLDDEIKLWYTIPTQIKTTMMMYLNHALVKKADDAVDEELRRTTWVWIDARNMWTCLKHRAWEDPRVASRIQGYLDDACAVLEVLQTGEQEAETAPETFGNGLLSLFDLSVRGSTSIKSFGMDGAYK